MLEPYRRASRAFREQVRKKLESGQETERVPVNADGTRYAIVDLGQLRNFEAQLFDLVDNPSIAGYLHAKVYRNLKATHHFLPVEGEHFIQHTLAMVQNLIQDGVPPFRTIPRHDLIVISPEGTTSYFPIQDYIIYLGAGLLGVQAASRIDKTSNEMLPVDSSAIRLFAQKAIVRGSFDPVAAKHLLRIVRSKFESTEVASVVGQRTLREADRLASTFENFSSTPKVFRELPQALGPYEAYQHTSIDPYWYLYYSDADRARISGSYSLLQHHEDLVLFSSQQISSFYEAASLVLDSLPAPREFYRLTKQRLQMPYEDVGPEGLRSMTSHTARKMGWTHCIVNDVQARLAALSESTPPRVLAEIFFGPHNTVLRAIDISGKLDTLEGVNAALDKGRIELIQRLNLDKLREILAAGFSEKILLTQVKFCGGAEYREIARESFSSIQDLR